MSPPAGAVRAPQSTPWAREADDLGHDLDVDIEVGLGAAEAAARLARHGPNEVQLQRDTPLWRSVLDQLRETMILVLLAAAVLTIATGDITDTAVILLVVVINTTVGVTQERRAIHAVATLRQLSAPTARVLRDGAAERVPTRDLVPGDVLLLAAGDVVGADARLVSARELQVDEALLTGESLPSDRAPSVLAANVALADRTNMVHAGTLVAHGTGQAMVVATGAASAIGQVASLLATRRPPATPLQRGGPPRALAIGHRGRRLPARRPWPAPRAAVGAGGGDRNQPGRRGRSGVAARGGGLRVGGRWAADGRPRRDHPFAARGGDARLGHPARLGQDRNADPGRDGMRRSVDTHRRRAGRPTPRAGSGHAVQPRSVGSRDAPLRWGPP